MHKQECSKNGGFRDMKSPSSTSSKPLPLEKTSIQVLSQGIEFKNEYNLYCAF